MQQTENSVRSLKALDGGLAAAEIRPILSAHADCAATVNALERILRASRAGLGFRPAQCFGDIPARVGGIRTSPAAHIQRRIFFRSNLPTEPGLDSDHSITRIRAFDPLIRTRLRSLDLALVATDTLPAYDDARHGLMTPSVAPGLPGYDEQTVDLACRYAMRFGRQSVKLLTGSRPCALEMQAVARLAKTFAERYPALKLTVLPVTEVLRSLMLEQASASVLVAAPTLRDVVYETASSLSGAPGLTTTTYFRSSEITVGTSDGLATTRQDVEQSEKPSALLLALIDLLVWLGHEEAAHGLIKGWSRTLEHGCHTEEFRLLRPDASCVDSARLADCVIQWMGANSQTLKPGFVGKGCEPARKRTPGFLRLV